MVGVVRDWRAELIEAYPDLFHPSANNPGVAAASPECGEGWNDLLQRACVRIRAAVQADGGRFKLTQIKEKFATIRIYWDGGACRKSNPNILVVQATQNRTAKNVSSALNGARYRRILVQRQMRAGLIVIFHIQ